MNTPSLLALDTSTDLCSAALLIGDEIQQQWELAPQQHGQLLLLMISELLATAGLSLKQLNGLAFSCGPGSFTGIRIATGVIQGLAYSADLPVIPVSTLQTLAQTAWRTYQAKKVLACLDARMHEIYWGVYQLNEQQLMTAIVPDDICLPATISVPEGDHWYGVGDGWKSYEDILRNTCGKSLHQIDADCKPLAQDVVTIAKEYFIQGKYYSAEQALPIYLRGAGAWKKIK